MTARHAPNATLPDGRRVRVFGDAFAIFNHHRPIAWLPVLFPDGKLRPVKAQTVRPIDSQALRSLVAHA